jgi:hypothetical protein
MAIEMVRKQRHISPSTQGPHLAFLFLFVIAMWRVKIKHPYLMILMLARPIKTTCLHLDSTCLLAHVFIFGLGFF